MPDRAEPGTRPALRPPSSYLLLTAALSGAAVLTLEVMGSRVIGPFFGVSLFVWTSLIVVTLSALAAGYAIGGRLADRRASADWLYGLVLVAALLTLAVPLARAPVLEASVHLGLRVGSLAATLALFGPVLFVLGCVTPYVVRLATLELESIGRTVGMLYAVSTLGSVAGAVLTGYVLIAWLGVNGIFTLTAAVLLALAVGHFAVLRRRPAALLLALLLAPAAWHPGSPVARVRMPDGTEVREIASAESFYGHVKVVDYRFGALVTREMTIDGLVQGGIDLRDSMPVYEYAYHMRYLPLALNPHGRRCLVIGLGAGLLPRWYEANGIHTDVVEIDPVVIAMAREHFGFRPRGEVFVTDARNFLLSASRRYDYLMLDVFNGDTTPAHLLSVEALTLAKRRLAAGGVLAINLVGSLVERTFVTASVVRTLEQVFDRVEIYPTFDPHAGDGAGNLVLVAYDGERREFDREALARLPAHPLAGIAVRERIGRAFRFPAGTAATVLTDDFNPVDVRDAWLRERVRRQILDSTHRGLLLGSRARPATPGAA